jgi:hypothetical protein
MKRGNYLQQRMMEKIHKKLLKSRQINFKFLFTVFNVMVTVFGGNCKAIDYRFKRYSKSCETVSINRFTSMSNGKFMYSLRTLREWAET